MWWYAVWFLQIVAESLPISSSSHVALAAMLAPAIFSGSLFCSPEQFEFLMHIPTIIVLVIYFFNAWWRMLFGQQFSCAVVCSKRFWSREKLQPIVSFFFLAESLTVVFWLVKKIVVAQTQVTFATQELMLTGLLVTGWLLLRSDSFPHDDEIDVWSLRNAWFLGCAQGLALLPGLSRMGVTVVVALWLGYKRADVLALSTLLCMPLLLASAVKALCHLDQIAIDQIITMPCLGVTIFAMACAYLGLLLAQYAIQKRTLHWFAFYLFAVVIAVRVYLTVT